MSKLIQRIERLGKDGPAPLGFGAASRRQPTPTMVRLASVADPSAAKKLDGISLDGLLFTPGTATGSTLAEAASGLKDVPWGVQVQNPTSDQVKELVGAGCDFITMTGLAAPLEALHDEELGKLLVVSAELKEEHAHSMEVLPVDVVLYANAMSSPLNLESLLELAAVRGEIGIPFLVLVNGALTTWELECLRGIGVEGVVADLASTDVDTLKALSQRIRDLPRRRARSDSASPSLPHVSARAQPLQDDEGDEEPEDPDDFP